MAAKMARGLFPDPVVAIALAEMSKSCLGHHDVCVLRRRCYFGVMSTMAKT